MKQASFVSRRNAALAGMLVVAVACNGRGGRQDGASGGIGTLDSTSAGSGSGTAATADSQPGESGSGSPSYDVGSAETGAVLGCTKVDFLFVIDNSVSMSAEQTALIDSFPGFIAAIQATLVADHDYHIMVVDTDAETRCTPANCADPANAPVSRVQDLCIDDGAGGYACSASFEACDGTLGAGVVHPAGEGSTNGRCEIEGGHRYLSADEPDLGGAFDCVARVGLAGDPSERPMNAMIAALSKEHNRPGGCNAGFLRDDAILVITLITDDPKYEDLGTPPAWYDSVVAAKVGDSSGVVVLGLLPIGACQPIDDPAAGQHWLEFVQLWGDHGLTAGSCEPTYVPFFEQAVEIIDATCDTFVPPG